MYSIKLYNRACIFFVIALAVFFPVAAKAQLQYVPETVYKITLAEQLKQSLQGLAALRKKGIKESSSLRMAFTFRTNSAKKANELVAQLHNFGYTAAAGKGPSVSWLHTVTGTSPAIIMSEKLVLEWTKVMCDQGYEFDCMFRGWKALTE